MLSTGNLPQGGLLRNSVDRITDRPDMISAVYRGRKASTQTNKQNGQVKLKGGAISNSQEFLVWHAYYKAKPDVIMVDRRPVIMFKDTKTFNSLELLQNCFMPSHTLHISQTVLKEESDQGLNC